MPYFVVYALDKPDSGDIRDKHRTEHRARLRNPGDIPIKVHIGGPMMDDAGTMIGSMLVVEAPSKEVVETFEHGDPYSISGLYESITIRPYKWGLGNPEEEIYG